MPVPIYTPGHWEVLEHNLMTQARGPFLERPSKLMGPVSYFEIKVSQKLGCVLASNEVHFVP